MVEVIKLIKRGDTYKPEKLEASIRGAGASEETAKKIVSSVRVYDGMPTLELRNQVTAQLRVLDPEAAKKYEAGAKKE